MVPRLLVGDDVDLLALSAFGSSRLQRSTVNVVPSAAAVVVAVVSAIVWVSVCVCVCV